MKCRVKLIWDEEAQVWIATSDDVPGLILESGSYDALVEKVKFAIPELLELNNRKSSFYDLLLTSERHEMVAMYG